MGWALLFLVGLLAPTESIRAWRTCGMGLEDRAAAIEEQGTYSGRAQPPSLIATFHAPGRSACAILPSMADARAPIRPTLDQCAQVLRAARISAPLANCDFVPMPDYAANIVAILNGQYVLRASVG